MRPEAILSIMVQAKGIERTSRDLKDIDRTAQRTAISTERLEGRFSRLDNTVGDFNRSMTGARNAMSLVKFPAMIASAGAATQAVGALGAGAVALGAALAPLAGLGAAAAVGLSAVAQAGGVVKLATAGISGALKEQLAAHAKVGSVATQSAASGVAAAKAVKAAEDGVLQAKEGVRTATLHVASAVRDQTTAGEDLTLALGKEKQAQKDLTQAREDAKRQLVDMHASLQDAVLGERSATIALEEARNDLNKVMSDATATDLDRRKAILAVDEAENRVADAQRDRIRTAKDTAKADKDGIKGSAGVVSAQQAVKDAHHDVIDAERRLADAERATAEARRALVRAQGDVVKAMREVTDAQAAATASSDKAAGAAAKLNTQFDALPPAAKAFLRVLLSLKPNLDALRATAAAGFFPGVTAGLKSAMKSFGAVKTVVGQTASTMGRLAEQAGELVGSKGFGKDLEKVGSRNALIIGRTGTAAIILADAFRHLVVAAGPLALWLSRLAVNGAEWIRAQVVAGRESGKLAGFLDHTRAVMKTLGGILLNLATGLYNIGKAATPLGTDLLDRFEKLTKAFADWTASATGKNQIAAYFAAAKEPLLQTFGLIGDISGALLRLSQGKEAGALVAQMRTLVPILENVVATTTAAFGPVLIDALGNVLRLVGALAGSNGPLVETVKLLGWIAGGLADLLSSNSGLNAMVVTTIGLYGSFRALAFVFGPLVTGVKLLEVALVGETAVSNAAAVSSIRLRASMLATAAAMYVTQAAAIAATAGTAALGVAAAVLTSPITGVILILAALGTALILAYQRSQTFRDVVNGAFNAVKNTVTGVIAGVVQVVRSGFTIIQGLVKVLTGVLTGDFGKAWDGVKQIFKGALGAIKGIIETYTAPFRAAIRALGRGLTDGFSAAWDGVRDLFNSGVNKVIDFLNFLIRAINKIPGVPEIKELGHIGDKSTGKGYTPPGDARGMARGGAFARTGGIVDKPITLMGEEAPRWPEFVVPTNPAYRGRAKGLLAQAAGAIGMAQGGAYSQGQIMDLWTGQHGAASRRGIASAIAMAESSGNPNAVSPNPAGGVNRGLWQIWSGNPGSTFDPAGNARTAIRMSGNGENWGQWEVFTTGAYKRFMGKGRGAGGAVPGDTIGDILSKFPKPSDLPDLFKGTGKYVIDKATEWVKKQITESPGGPVGRFGKPSGPAGTSQFMGLTMADWVIESLKYAQKKGVDVRPTSGYRSHATNVAAGRMYHSEHEGTQYPHGAVDFGGFNSGLAMKMAVVNATSDFKYPLLAPIGFHDDGHASGTGHAKGGVFKYLGGFKHGGITGSDGMAYLHANEAVIPLKKGGKSTKHYSGPSRGITRNAGQVVARKLPRRRGPIKGGYPVAPVESPAVGGGDGGDAGEDPNQALIDSNAALQAAIEAEAEVERQRIALTQLLIDNQLKVLALANQGPQILAAVVAAVNGGIGGRVGLGTQSPSYAGGVSRYR